MGASTSRPAPSRPGPPPENGVRVTAGLLQRVVDQTQGAGGDAGKRQEQAKNDGASTSTSPSKQQEQQQRQQHQQHQHQRHPQGNARMFGVPDLSPLDFEAARIAAVDHKLAADFRKSATIARGQLRVEENEASAVAAAADELLRRCDDCDGGGGGGEVSSTSGASSSSSPPSSLCEIEAAAVATCYVSAAAAAARKGVKKGGEARAGGGISSEGEAATLVAALGCRGVVEALESCARKAAAARTEALAAARLKS